MFFATSTVCSYGNESRDQDGAEAKLFQIKRTQQASTARGRPDIHSCVREEDAIKLSRVNQLSNVCWSLKKLLVELFPNVK